MRDVQFTDYPTARWRCRRLCRHEPHVVRAKPEQHISLSGYAAEPVSAASFIRATAIRRDHICRSFFSSRPTFGVQPMSQQLKRFLSVSEGGADYMTSVDEYQAMQNGVPPTRQLVFDPTLRFTAAGPGLDRRPRTSIFPSRNTYGRFSSLMGIKSAVNPGNPYGYPNGVSRTQHGFVTFGSEFCNLDAATTMAEMSTRALKAAWFHKWIVNLRMRPEEYGALVHANLTHAHPFPQAAGAIHPDMLNSQCCPSSTPNTEATCCRRRSRRARLRIRAIPPATERQEEPASPR